MAYTYNPVTVAAVTRAAIRREILRRVGGQVGEVDSGSTTTAVVQEFAYIGSGDDNHYVGWRLNMPDLSDALATRVCSAWDDSAGQFTWATATSDTIADADTIEVYPPAPDPFVKDFDDAINRTLQETERLVETVLPTVEGQYRYPLLNAPWVQHMGDIEGAFLRGSPNLVDNANFDYWGRGESLELAGWTLNGGSAAVTRGDGEYSRFAVNLARTTNDCYIGQTIPVPIEQMYGKTISASLRAKTSTASIGELLVTDGTDTTSSSQHDGGGDWDTLTVSHTVNSDAAGPLQIRCRTVDSDGNVDFDRVIAVEGSSIDTDLTNYGDQFYRFRDVGLTVQMQGTLPVIHTRFPYDRGQQIVVVSRQPFAAMSADSDETDMQLECAVAGSIVKLAEVYAKGQHRERWDALGQLWRPIYESWKRRYIQHGDLNPTPAQHVIGSA